MDKLSIFAKATGTVQLESEENNTIDTLANGLEDIRAELRLTRKGHEEWTWGEEVENSEDIDLEELNG